jgi:hypothetical protein
MTPKQHVLAVNPEAKAYRRSAGWVIWGKIGGGIGELGSGPSGQAAWRDAAARLANPPKPAPLPAPAPAAAVALADAIERHPGHITRWERQAAAMLRALATPQARMDAARDFPAVTCAASRHAQHIAEALLSGRSYPMLTEDPQHCGESIAATVAALWEARARIAELEAEDASRELHRDLLRRTAIALNGPEDGLATHGWSDLPEIAADMRARLEAP